VMEHRYMVLVDGAVCAVGLAWRQALVEAGRLMRALSTSESDESVVTISEMVLAEPRMSWSRVGPYWDCRAEPIWLSEAA